MSMLTSKEAVEFIGKVLDKQKPDPPVLSINGENRFVYALSKEEKDLIESFRADLKTKELLEKGKKSERD